MEFSLTYLSGNLNTATLDISIVCCTGSWSVRRTVGGQVPGSLFTDKIAWLSAFVYGGLVVVGGLYSLYSEDCVSTKELRPVFALQLSLVQLAGCRAWERFAKLYTPRALDRGQTFFAEADKFVFQIG